MRATFEHGGTIIDIGNHISCDELDTSGTLVSSRAPIGSVAVGIYQRGMTDPKSVAYKAGFVMKSSEARAMASAMLGAATEAKA